MTTVERMKKVFDNVFDGEIKGAAVSENAKLKDDLEMNSIAMLYMVMGLEEEFGIRFENSDFAKLITVKDVIDCIEGKIS